MSISSKGYILQGLYFVSVREYDFRYAHSLPYGLLDERDSSAFYLVNVLIENNNLVNSIGVIIIKIPAYIYSNVTKFSTNW